MKFLGFLRRKSPFDGIEWCHGDWAGSIHIESHDGATTVAVKCSDCASDKWTLKHAECPECGHGGFSTSCVRTEDGYRVTFTCSKCGNHDVHRQWEREE